MSEQNLTAEKEFELVQFVAQLDELLGAAEIVNAEFAFEVAALAVREDTVAALRKLRLDAGRDHQERIEEARRIIANEVRMTHQAPPPTPAEHVADQVEQAFGRGIWAQ